MSGKRLLFPWKHRKYVASGKSFQALCKESPSPNHHPSVILQMFSTCHLPTHLQVFGIPQRARDQATALMKLTL